MAKHRYVSKFDHHRPDGSTIAAGVVFEEEPKAILGHGGAIPTGWRDLGEVPPPKPASAPAPEAPAEPEAKA